MARNGGDDDFGGIVPSLPGAVDTDEPSSQKAFVVPNLEPLVRQRGLMLEQSELLREQFLRFCESMQQLQGMLSQLQDELKVERLERMQSQERNSLSIASLRKDLDSDRRKQEMMVKQVEEGLNSLREEVLSQARVSESEAQRINASIDALKGEWLAKMTPLVDKQQTLVDKLREDVAKMQETERKAHDTNLSNLREDVVGMMDNKLNLEANKRDSSLKSSLKSIEESHHVKASQVQEECLARLHVLETLRVSGEENLKAETKAAIGALKLEIDALTHQFDAEVRQRSASTDLLTQRVQEHFDHHTGSLQTAEECRLADLAASKEVIASLTSELSTTEIALARQTAYESEHLADKIAQRMVIMSAEMNSVEVEMQKEIQQKAMATVGLATEVSELRNELSHELIVRENDNKVLREMMTPATLGQTLLDRTSKLHERADELHIALSARADELQSSMSAQLQKAADDAHLGREELWHVLGSLQDSATLAQDEVHVLKAHTKHLEEDVSEKVESFASTSTQLTGKMESLHNYCLDRHTTTTALLNMYKEELVQSKKTLDSLASSRDFLESPNLNHRLYVTNHGDIAVFQSNNWGRHAANFLGIPRWVAASSEHPTCAVTREMKPHEKDRFLALANRATQNPAS